MLILPWRVELNVFFLPRRFFCEILQHMFFVKDDIGTYWHLVHAQHAHIILLMEEILDRLGCIKPCK